MSEKLIGSLSSSIESGESEPSKLRGDLARGKRVTEPYSVEWLQEQTLVQRDSGKQFKVLAVNESDKGAKVVLEEVEGKARVTKFAASLLQDLKESGTAWSVG